jgi:hypothetical protein
MIINGNEILEPEELTQLGVVFDETWAAIKASTGDGSVELRTALACTLLQLAHLRQLGPDQMKATALRLFRAEPIAPTSRLSRETEDCSASSPQGA